MKSDTPIGRRKFIVLSGATGVVAGAYGFAPFSVGAQSVPEPGRFERLSLDTGERAPRSGPVVTLKNGELIWATTEPEAPYLAKAMWPISRIVLRRSTDSGRSWGAPRTLLTGTDEYSLLSHTLRATASGTLLHIFCRYSGYDYETGLPAKSLNQVFAHRSTDGGKTWSAPQQLPLGERYSGDVLSSEQLRDGRIVYPCCFLTNERSQFACSALYSDDDGRTWLRSESVLRVGGGGFESGASEPSVVELPGGKLWMLIRAQTGFLWESFSSDRGKTWSPAAATSLTSSNAPATALRLRSGEIAIAWNNHVQSNYARQSLVLGITKDGRTFSGLREIDFTDYPDNPAQPVNHVTYSYLTESRDGDIIVSYNKGTWSRHNRPTLARVSRAWLSERSDLSDLTDGRTGWHTINPGTQSSAAVEKYVRSDKENLWLEIQQNPKSKAPTGIVRSLPLVANGQIEVAVHVVRPGAFILFGDTLLHPNNINEACIRLRFADDKIFLGSGVPNRKQNDRKDTQFAFLSHKIQDEIPYSATPATGVMLIRVRYDASQSKAEIRINNGSAVEVRTGSILGLMYLGLCVADGGVLQVRSVKTELR